MSNPIKNLAGQTIIYGLGTILPRFLNYLLTPLLVWIFQRPADYGVNSELFSVIAFMNVIFTYGMETSFFNFSTKREDKAEVYNTTLSTLITSSLGLCLLLFIFSGPIAKWLDYPDKINFIYWIILIITADAITAIPFAKLRLENKAKKFAIIRAINVLVNVTLHIFFFVFCKHAFESGEQNFLASMYNPEIGIGYSFLSTLVASLTSLFLLGDQFKNFRFKINKQLLIEMFHYAWPLLIVGVAGMINDTFDRFIIKHLLPKEIGQQEQGIYGACYKLSILMVVFIQAFRFAAEPFFFNNAKDKDSKKVYAFVMKAFVIFCSFIFLATMMNLPVLKYFAPAAYRVGLDVVPILLLANLFLGVYYNLGIWYKLSGQTKFGAYITIVGAVITLIINFAFVPKYSYMACAWATFAAYGVMMVISYYIGKKYYPIKYNFRAIGLFFFLSLGMYFLSLLWKDLETTLLKLFLNNLLVLLFVYLFYKLEFSNIKKFKKTSSADSQSN